MYIPCFQYRLYVPEDSDESGEDEVSSEDEIGSTGMNTNLSQYEIQRKERIAENKKKFQEHLAAITSANKATKKVYIYIYTTTKV